MANGKRGTVKTKKPEAKEYRHSEAESLMRPEIGTQTRFKKKLPPAKFRYDDSLAPVMEWDGQNAARDKGEWLLGLIEEASALPAPHLFVPARELKDSQGAVVATVTGLRDAVAQLKAMSKPFLNWSGKAERTSFDVPSLPLFIHERLSTKAILETLKGHKRDKQTDMFDLFGDPEHSGTEQILRAYEYQDKWVNRMMLGDSLVVMNSLLKYEQMGGRVQMIYMDPPYGVKFGSNFQPFVRKRDVKNGDDADMTREPEMVQAYRDTWELGLHSYLTYLRDRLLVARDLLTPSGSIFVQISDENLHHVREVMDEVFGSENCVSTIAFSKTSSASGDLVSSTTDYLVWYAKDIARVKFRKIYQSKIVGGDGGSAYNRVLLPDGVKRTLSVEEKRDLSLLPKDARIYRIDNLTSQRPAQEGDVKDYEFQGKKYGPGKGTFKTDRRGLDALAEAGRLECTAKGLYYVRFFEDFPLFEFTNLWEDTGIAGFAVDKLYVVQTSDKVISRCIQMTTDPGDLVLDPTCGSGTTAYVAEEWGRTSCLGIRNL